VSERLQLVLGLVVFAHFGCSAPPDAGASLSGVSEQGLARADLRFEDGLRRGSNSLWTELESLSHAEPRLVRVEALMVSHSHRAACDDIEKTSQGFHAPDLNLFMSGRWRLELELLVGAEPDSVTFAIDVP
jgi:hypothetical protein